MSLFIEIFLIGVGLSMDAFAVSIYKGLSMKKIKKRDVFRTSAEKLHRTLTIETETVLE